MSPLSQLCALDRCETHLRHRVGKELGRANVNAVETSIRDDDMCRGTEPHTAESFLQNACHRRKVRENKKVVLFLASAPGSFFPKLTHDVV